MSFAAGRGEQFTGGAFTIDVQCHRGARGVAPENTLAAFALALLLAATALNQRRQRHLLSQLKRGLSIQYNPLGFASRK